MGKGSLMNMSYMLRKMAMGWLVLGLAGLVFVTIFAISHYVFEMPVHEGHSGGHLATQVEVADTIITLGGGFFLFAAFGGGVLLWLKKR